MHKINIRKHLKINKQPFYNNHNHKMKMSLIIIFKIIISKKKNKNRFSINRNNNKNKIFNNSFVIIKMNILKILIFNN